MDTNFKTSRAGVFIRNENKIMAKQLIEIKIKLSINADIQDHKASLKPERFCEPP